MSKKGGFGKLLAGIGIGVGLGMLFSPKSGKENREDLKNQTKKLVNKVKEIDLEEVKENLVKEYEKLVEELKDMDMEKAKKIAVREGNKIMQKASDLIKAAEEKSKPAISKAAGEVKTKVATLLKNMANKLEN